MDNNLEGQLRAAMANMDTSEVNLDGVEQWGKPSLQGQFSDTQTWRIEEVLVRVYNLSNEKDTKDYQEVLSSTYSEEPELIVLEQDRIFCEKESTWKIFVVSAKIEYKKLTGTDKA